MSRVGYGYGSEWHLLRWLAYHRAELSRRVAQLIGAEGVQWLDSAGDPSASGPFERDLEWVNLDFLPAGHPARAAWRSTWPRAWGRVGPHWDAIGRAMIDGTDEWVLVEAKANVDEVTSSVSATVADASRAMIEATFDAAAASFGCNSTASWLRGGYQIANRLCTLDVLNRHGAPAHLLFIYFCGDDADLYRRGGAKPGRSGVCCPRDESEWRELVLDDLHARMGWHPRQGLGRLGPRVHELFLNVGAAEQTSPS